MDEAVKVKGYISWVFTKEDGTVETGERDNIITTVGKQWLAQYLTASTPPANIGWIGFGSGTTAVAVGDTALTTELNAAGYARPAVTRSNSSQTAQYVATLTGLTNATPGAPVNVNEVGLFNAVTAGTMFAHQLTGQVQFTSSTDSLQVTWQVTFN